MLRKIEITTNEIPNSSIIDCIGYLLLSIKRMKNSETKDMYNEV